MHLTYTPEQDKLRAELREYFAALMTPDRRDGLAAAGGDYGDGTAYRGAFCCDTRHLVNQGGIPTIIFGPGTIAQAHKPDEHIVLSDYFAAIEHLIEFIPHWCNAGVKSRAHDRRTNFASRRHGDRA